MNAPKRHLMQDGPTSGQTNRRHRWKHAAKLLCAGILVYLVVAYLLMPSVWKRYTGKHPSLEDLPGVTYTADGIPADPINVALIGTKDEVIKIMLAAKWHPADKLAMRSSLKI